jgi:hypothetical protein
VKPRYHIPPLVLTAANCGELAEPNAVFDLATGSYIAQSHRPEEVSRITFHANIWPARQELALRTLARWISEALESA